MNPLIGVLFHWLGGLASGSFYVPYRMVRNWSWETYWLVGGFFAWLIAPWVFALLLTHDPGAAIKAAETKVIFQTYAHHLHDRRRTGKLSRIKNRTLNHQRSNGCNSFHLENSIMNAGACRKTFQTN